MRVIREWLTGWFVQANGADYRSHVKGPLRERFFPVSPPNLMLTVPVFAYPVLGGPSELVLVLFLVFSLNCLFLTMLEFIGLVLICNLIYTAFIWWEPRTAAGADILIGLLLFNVLLLCVRYRIFHKIMLMSESNRHLAGVARIDSLTGSYNRSFLIEAGRRVFNAFVRRSEPFCVLILDIDHSREVNDSYGHGGVDMALIRLADLLERAVRLDDVSGRYGNDEFMIIMSDTTLDGALFATRRMRRLIAQPDGEASHASRGLRISMGLAQVRVADRDFDDVVRRAHEALHEAKRSI